MISPFTTSKQSQNSPQFSQNKKKNTQKSQHTHTHTKRNKIMTFHSHSFSNPPKKVRIQSAHSKQYAIHPHFHNGYHVYVWALLYTFHGPVVAAAVGHFNKRVIFIAHCFTSRPRVWSARQKIYWIHPRCELVCELFDSVWVSILGCMSL